MIIVGAGLAGLIAGHVFPNASIVERSPEPEEAHRALLRFRSSAVSELTGIPFRRVRVTKGIWHHRRFVQPSILTSNLYSRKVTNGSITARSIDRIEAVDRFVAPEDFYGRLIDATRRRTSWGEMFDGWHKGGAKISTAPLPIPYSALFPSMPLPRFDYAAIEVDRYRIADCDAFQTVYFPSLGTSTYRASITGSTLIVESMCGATNVGPKMALPAVLEPFGIHVEAVVPFADSHRQQRGKIAPIDDAWRREAIHELSREFNVWSVGRFATWRNILLDDVVADLRAVQSMIDQKDRYAMRRIA